VTNIDDYNLIVSVFWWTVLPLFQWCWTILFHCFCIMVDGASFISVVLDNLISCAMIVTICLG
jgi:hypothetical protein